MLVAECYTQQSLCRVYLGLRRVPEALGKVTVSVVIAVVQSHPTFSFSPEGQPWVSPFVLGGKHALAIGIEMASLKPGNHQCAPSANPNHLSFVAVASGRTTAQTTQNGLSDWRPELQMPRD